MKYKNLIPVVIVLSAFAAQADEVSKPEMPEVSLPSLSNIGEPPPPPPPPGAAGVAGGGNVAPANTKEVPQQKAVTSADTNNGTQPSVSTPEVPPAATPPSDKSVVNTPATPAVTPAVTTPPSSNPVMNTPAVPANEGKASPQADLQNTNLPPEIVRMLKEKNINISQDAAAKAAQELSAENAAKEKAKIEREKQLKEDERQKQLKEARQEEEMMPPILYRDPYDHQVMGSPQLYKHQYGANNVHLPIIRNNREYSQYFFVAAIADDIGAMRALLAKGADINAVSVKHGYTPLMYATKNRKYRAMSYLMTQGAALEVVGLDGRSALRIAKDIHDSEAIGLLLAAGANPLSSASNSNDDESDEIRDSVIYTPVDAQIESESLIGSDSNWTPMSSTYGRREEPLNLLP